ncbi:50S ribosomal protein L9 [Acidithiobacillus sp. AMEEHan]|uniref:50S ribosomal protein L9 n=1 Tax=Acidithiobacillus sp. AMEEHan TaxID=2994951 RepID=UPI0027E49F7E|nr:50S ribosomal protein L9 [Acidithiobacillus sp. AMEEHan]
MKVILLERINKLGRLGDVVEVRPGYGRNFLVPQGKAVVATPNNLADFAARKAQLEAAEAERLQAARVRAEALADTILRIALQAGEDGRLFGSVGHHDVARMLEDMGHQISHGEVRMQEGPIKRTGEYPVRLHLHPEVEIDIQVVVERA